MKKIIFSILFMTAVPCFSVWDKTKPLGSEAANLADDYIRETRSDVETALQFGSTQYFPGTDTSNPRYIPTISTFTTATRPTGNNAPPGRLIINVSSGTFEIVDSAGNWTPIKISTPSYDFNSVNTNAVQNGNLTGTDIDDGTLSGIDIQTGGITGQNIALETIVSTAIFNGTIVSTDIAQGGVASYNILDGTIMTIDILDDAVTHAKIDSFPKFSVYNAVSMYANETGDGTAFVLRFDDEKFDDDAVFSASTFTVPVNGTYMLYTQVHLLDALTSGATSFLLRFESPNGDDPDCEHSGFIQTSTNSVHSDQLTLSASCLFQEASGTQATVVLRAWGGTRTIDVDAARFYGYLIP